MGIFAKEPATGDPTVAERERSDSFESLLRLPTAPAQSNTVITSDMTLTGSLQGEGTVHIEGKVIGEIELNGSVVVARGGEIRGPVTTDNIQIAGRVEGNITARQQLHLESNGSVDGDISATSLIIENGGSFNGRSTMFKQSGAAKPHLDMGNRTIPSTPKAAPSVARTPSVPRMPAAPKSTPAPSAPIQTKPRMLLDDDDDDDDFPPRRR